MPNVVPNLNQTPSFSGSCFGVDLGMNKRTMCSKGIGLYACFKFNRQYTWGGGGFREAHLYAHLRRKKSSV